MIQAGEGQGEHRRLSTAVQRDPLLGFVLFFCTERVLYRKGFVQDLFVEEDFPGKVPFMISLASAAFSNFSLPPPPSPSFRQVMEHVVKCCSAASRVGSLSWLVSGQQLLDERRRKTTTLLRFHYPKNCAIPKYRNKKLVLETPNL